VHGWVSLPEKSGYTTSCCFHIIICFFSCTGVTNAIDADWFKRLQANWQAL
jgi:hypothetical protein